jgi:hypothetical protein
MAKLAAPNTASHHVISCHVSFPVRRQSKRRADHKPNSLLHHLLELQVAAAAIGFEFGFQRFARLDFASFLFLLYDPAMYSILL